jgi:G:T-mismatch repair DNA endonuclease (very short patch repair protein)
MTVMKIEYYSVFEAYKAHRLLEELDGKRRIRDHVYGKLQFNITRDEHDYLKLRDIGYMILEP